MTSEEATVAVFWAGVVPYYTGRVAIDCLGKSDPHIAHLAPDLSGAVSWSRISSVPGHNKYDLRYSIVQRQPTYIERDRWARDDISAWAAEHYVAATYRGVPLLLLRGSPHVRWDLLDGKH